MAEQVNLKVELQSNLDKLVGATKAVKLDKGQAERVERYTKGAQLALDSGDLKTFQRNFNGLIKTFKDAAAATGKVSEEIQKMTTRQAALSKEINQLKDKKTKLETHTSGGKLTKEGAKSFYGESQDAKKVIKADGTQATRDEIIKIQTALAEFLKESGKALKQLTNEDMKEISKRSGVEVSQRNSGLAADRYVKAENAYAGSLPGQIKSTTEEIGAKEQEYATLTTQLTNMTEAAGTTADSIEKLYAEISKLGDATNKAVTEEINKNTKKKADTTVAPTGAPDTPQLDKQTSSLGKAFKQFTLYNLALKATKVALREAVQTVKELDQYLTEQAMVTGKTREETYALVGAYQELAAQCGATTKEIAQVATEYMKQGKSTQEALVLTEAAVKAAKVARVSVGDSVNYLTTALNGFQLEASEAMAVSDKFAALAAASATDYDELAIALSKVASQANLAGMSMDYTTALLTKGLETTREAPETMGTALKTIIARMRELGDYGETLDDGMDINNVEKQLAYVDIALRDTSGELRSTEDVLDELGKKWDTLSKNQQAAVAKALAGTRQQARLIAMMEDYERVTELQEISQRSAGATAAQAGVYLEGMEAAMNNIQVAWEKIVMTISDNEFIISFFEWISDALNGIAEFLSTDFGIVTALTLAATIGMHILTNKINEVAQQRLYNIEAAKAKGEELERQKVQKETRKIQIQSLKKAAEELKTSKLNTAEEKKKSKIKALDLKLENKQIDAATHATELMAIETEYATEKGNIEAEYRNEIAKLDAEEKALTSEISALETQISANKLEQVNTNSTLLSIFGAFIPVLSTIITLMSLWSTIQSIINAKKKKSIDLTKKQTLEEGKNAAASGAKAMGEASSAGAKSGGLPGLIAGLAIGAAIIATIAGIIGIAMAVTNASKSAAKAAKDKTAEGTADNINELSNSIYNLTKKANELNKISSAFEEIDSKVIKTKKDTEELKSLLDSAGDSMSTEKEKDSKGEEIEGSSEKEKYDLLQTDEERLKFIKNSAAEAEAEADRLRQQQLAEAKRLKSENYSEYKKMLTDSSSSSALAAQSAIRAIAYDNLYDHIDKLKESGQYSSDVLKDTEELTSSLISNMSALDAIEYADNAKKMQALADSIMEVQITLNNGKKAYASDIFLDEGKTIKERITAYRELEEALQNDEVALKALQEAYADWATLSGWDQAIIDFIDATNLSVDKINSLYDSFEVLQKQGVSVTREQYKGMMDSALKDLDPSMSNLNEVLNEHFGDMLRNGGDFADNWETLLNQISNIFSESILDMGQNMEKFNNTVNGFYEKAMEWGEMSESERMEFISENAEMFTGAGGEELLNAFKNSDYDAIETLLGTQMEEQRLKRLAEVERTLAIEEARSEDKQNKAYISELKRYKAYLEDTDSLYKASLELRLEQEEKQLDQYRELLEKEQDALVKSLEKRKEAYEKYFDDIAQEEEDQDYEEESERLSSNIAKLASSSDADARAKTMELEQELQELEKERLQTLKERAREAILENMDNEIEEINDKFDKLLDSNQALLAAMQGDLEDPTEFLTKMIGNKFTDGATQLQLEDYIGNLESIYGNTLDGVDWDAIKEEVISQLFLNVNGQDITLNEVDERAVYTAVKKALQSIGKR